MLHLIHRLVGSGVLMNSLLIWLAFVQACKTRNLQPKPLLSANSLDMVEYQVAGLHTAFTTKKREVTNDNGQPVSIYALMPSLPPAVSCRYILFVGKQVEPGANCQQRVSLKSSRKLVANLLRELQRGLRVINRY